MKENKLLTYCCSDEENRYRVELISELIHMYEHPEDSNDVWKKAVVDAAREKGYGYENPRFSITLEKLNDDNRDVYNNTNKDVQKIVNNSIYNKYSSVIADIYNEYHVNPFTDLVAHNRGITNTMIEFALFYSDDSLSGIRDVIKKHTEKLNNIKENRAIADDDNESVEECRHIDSMIRLLASVLSDLNRTINKN